MDDQSKLFFGEFNSISSHIPPILFKQLVAHKVQELQNKKENKYSQDYYNNSNNSSSIRRFHGILLFVDISGFTSLSQKMTVEQFTNHINIYFTKIIDIIQKFNGEVVKFAGDALYAIWQLKSDDNIDSCIANTILCAGMINSTCNNYKITFVKLDSETGYLSPRGRLKDSNRRMSTVIDGSAPNSARSNVSFDSPSGRIRGSFKDENMPTRRSSQSVEANSNNFPFLSIKDSNSSEENTMTRGSRRNSVMVDPIDEDAPVRRNSLIFTANNRRSSIASNNSGNTPARRNSILIDGTPLSLDKLDTSLVSEALLGIANLEMQKEVVEETVYLFVHSGISAGVMAGVDVSYQGRSEFFLIGQPMHDVATAEKQATKGELVLSLNGIDEVLPYLTSGVKCDIRLDNLSDNCYRVNFCGEVTKFFGDDSSILKNNFTASLLRDLTSAKDSLLGDSSPELLSTLKSHVHEAIRSNGKSANELEMSIQQALNVFDKKKKSKSRRKMSVAESIYSCEVRNVVTLFIRLNIDLSMTILTHEENNCKASNIPRDLFDFLVPTDLETDSDNDILNILQTCYATISKSLHKLSGQIRQFILDDKGTVCIGSFGLKGSNTENNATAAVSAARSIVKDLKEKMDVESAIGVTTGRVFCGLVGSMERSEYSIMGPSVNLSARLMCAADFGCILCDHETRSSDQIHSFVASGEIEAKGYSHKIATFSPIIAIKNSKFNSYRSSSTASEDSFRLSKLSSEIRFSKLSRQNTQNGTIRKSGMDEDKRVKKNLHGRNKEVQSIINFVLGFESLQIEPNDSIININTTKLAFITGSQGLGKSEFITAIGNELASYKSTEISNISRYNVYRCRCANSCSTVVFSIWKKIILDMLLGSILSENNNSLRTDNDELFYVDKAGNKHSVDINHFMYQYLIKNKLEDYLSLLNNFIFETNVFKDNDIVNFLLGNEKIDMKVNLLFAIIQSYTVYKKRTSVFIFDDLHFSDIFSWLLIKKLFEKGSEIIVIGSRRTEVSSPSVIGNPLVQSEIVSLSLNGSNNPRVLFVDLSPLNKHATNAVIKDIFSPYIKAIDAILELICTYITGLCGGNARYIIEFCQLVTKAIGNYLEENHILPNDVLTEQQQNEVQSIVFEIGPKQIEDIFIQRFDQLPNDFQLILKAAAAISIGGNKFSVACLSFILPELSYISDLAEAFETDSPFVGNNGKYENTLLVAIEELLNINFLSKEEEDIISGNLPIGRRLSSSQTTQEIESDLRFSSSLEQNIIYDMMLKSQKKVLHERIALFYESISDKSLKNIEDYSILGVHWESANNWTRAMDYFYRVSTLYEMESLTQESHKYLILSYQMLQEMKTGQRLTRVSAFDVSEFAKEDIHLNLLESNNDLKSDENISLCLETVCQMFRFDWSYLEVALRMLSQFADSLLRFKKNSRLAAEIYEEGLELLLVSLKPDMISEIGEEIFYIHDPSTIFFLLNNYLSLVRYNKEIIEKDGVDYRENRLIDNFITISEKYGEHIHLLRAKTLFCEVKKKIGKYSEFLNSIQVLRNMYNFEQHSISLVKAYGSDCVLTMVASAVIYFLLLGDFHNVKEYLEFVQKYTTDPRLEINSQNLISITLTTVFILVRQYQQAHDCMNVSFKSSNDFVFASSIKYFKSLSSRLKEKAISKPIIEEENDSNAFLLLSILSSKDNNCLSQTNLIAMERKIGIGEDSLKAQLCLLHAEYYLYNTSPLNNKVLACQYCEAGLKYVNNSFARTSQSDRETVSCRLINLWLKVKLIMINDVDPIQIRKEECLKVLEESLLIGKSLFFAEAISGYLLCKFDIDKKRGEEIIITSRGTIIKVNNISEENLIGYSSLFPLLSKIL